jgi:hypothetical protein
MENRRRQIGPIWWVIQATGTKASNLRSWSHTCVLSSNVMFEQWLLHMRTSSSKSCFQLSQQRTMPLLFNVCARKYNLRMHQAFKVPASVRMTLPADTAAWWHIVTDLLSINDQPFAHECRSETHFLQSDTLSLQVFSSTQAGLYLQFTAL